MFSNISGSVRYTRRASTNLASEQTQDGGPVKIKNGLNPVEWLKYSCQFFQEVQLIFMETNIKSTNAFQ